MKNKQVFLTLVLAGFTSVLFGQEYALDKGASFVSATGSISIQGGELYEDNQYNRLLTMSFYPSYNHFVAKNFFIGGGFEFSAQNQGNNNVNSVGIGPQIGYAAGNSSSTAFPFVSVGIRYYTMNFDYADLGSSNANGLGYHFGFGLLVPLRDHVGLAFEGGYHVMKVKVKGSNVSYAGNTIVLGFGIIGLLY